MEPTPPTTTDAPPRRRSKWKWVVLACVVLVVVATVASVPWTNSSPSLTIRFVAGGSVPKFAITNCDDVEVHLRLQLECQTNGQWIPWPSGTNVAPLTPLANIDVAHWREDVKPHTGRLTQPWFAVDSTTLPLRLHGFVAKEMTGFAKLQHRWHLYRSSFNSKNPALRNLALSATMRSYPIPNEFFTASFCMTNVQAELQITMGKQTPVDMRPPSIPVPAPSHPQKSYIQQAPLRRRTPDDSTFGI